MNQPNSPRPSDDPTAKSLAQGLFGLNFAPGGPVADPDDLDGLDFDLLPDAPKSEPVAAAVEVTAESEPEAPAEPEPVAKSQPVQAKAEKTRKSAPRIRVPRDDDADDGFGAGLLDAFDDDDDDDAPVEAVVSVSVERTSVMKFAEIDVPADDDEPPAKPARKARAPRKPAAKKVVETITDEKVVEDSAPVEDAEPEVAADKPKDDYWDALEGWDWEISESSGDAEPAARSAAPSGRGRGPRRPEHDKPASRSEDRPRREKPVREERAKVDEEAPAKTERPRRPERKPKTEPTPAPKVESILDEGGFADDLFERLEPTTRGHKKSIPALSQLAAELDDDEPPVRADADDSDDSPSRGRRRGRGRGRDSEPAPRARAEEPPVRSAPRDEVFEDDDDGFGSGLAAPRRTERRPAEPEAPRGRRPARDLDEPEERPARPARRPREEVAEEPPRRRPVRDEVRSDRDRDEEPARPRARDSRDLDRDERPRRDRDDRPAREDRPARDDRPSRDARPARAESSEPPRRSRRDERPSRDDDSVETERPKVKTVEVPTWEHAISLLVRRPPKQDRGGDRPGGAPRGDDRGGSRGGRGRRRSNES